MSSSTANYYKQRFYQAANKAGQAASNARQFVSGAANAFTNPVLFSPIAPVNRFASSGNSSSGSGVASDGEYKMFTRAQLNDLYGNKSGNRGSSFMNTNFFSLGEGPIEHIIMMFQLYIALIAALSRLSMNAASMSASFLFGNETLINIFSIFLENALNLILNRNVADMSLDQLHQSLEANKPKLQQMSALLINEISALALGLSDVCSKIATDWITNVLPGLLKSSAIGASSAAEAGINAATMGAFGELVEIFSAGAAAVGGMMKIMNGLQSNIGNFKEAYGKVSNAYDGLVKLKELFSKSPSEIAAAATAAVIPQTVQKIADRAVNALAVTNPFLSSPNTTLGNAVGTTLGTAIGTAIGAATNKGINNIANGLNAATNVANKGVQLGLKGISGISNGLKGAASTISNLFLTTPTGKPVTDAAGIPIKISLWNRISKSLFDGAMKKIKDSGKYGQVNATIVQYILRNPDILIPFLPVPYNVAAVAFRLVQTYINHVYQPKTAAVGAVGGNRRYKNKSIKNKKYFKKYMSTLRRKTEKKELDLLNGIRDLKTMISL
jgi:hypothetical protein